MIDKKQARLRRARKTRAKIAELKAVRLCVNRTNLHIYAQLISACGSKVLASASTLETGVRAGHHQRRQRRRCRRCGQAHRRARQGGWYRNRRLRPFGLPVPRPRQRPWPKLLARAD